MRVGYYVNNEYEKPELNEKPPVPHQPQLIHRLIVADAPRVTVFPNDWDNAPVAQPPVPEIVKRDDAAEAQEEEEEEDEEDEMSEDSKRHVLFLNIF